LAIILITMQRNKSKKNQQSPEQKDKIAKLFQTVEEYDKLKIDFLKWLVIISIGFITVFTSFTTEIIEEELLQKLYVTVVVSMTLGIFFAAISFWGILRVKELGIMMEIDIIGKNDPPRVTYGKLDFTVGFYVVIQWLTFLSYLCFVISFIAFNVIK